MQYLVAAVHIHPWFRSALALTYESMFGANGRRVMHDVGLSWLTRAWRRVSRSPTLARHLFAIEFPPVGERDLYFDVTTPLLVWSAARRLRRGMRLLDMGTGAYAVVGLSLWRRIGCDVVATDVHPRILEQARANVDLNRAPVRVVQSRFFDALDNEEFDVVAFNPPYVPSRFAIDPTYARPFDVQSNGGDDGTTVIVDFLDEFAKKGGRASAFLTINELFVSGKRITDTIRSRSDLVLERIDRFPGSPFFILVIGRSAASARPPL